MLDFAGLLSKTLTFFFNLHKLYYSSDGVFPQMLSPTAGLFEEKQKVCARQK